jgi:ATP-dependent RNA helicase DeaD
MEAIERHIGTSIAPWSEGASTGPATVTARPRRHEKPHVHRPADEPRARLIASGGRAAGIAVADLVAAVMHATGLDGEAVSDVTVLERFALLSVPESEADRVVASTDGVEVCGHRLALERAAE